MSGKVIKKPKDVNAPKKNQSSYFIYSNERRPILQKETQQPVTEISKTISAEWKAMDPSQKKVYEDRAAEQKQRYLLELEAYKETDNYAKYQKKFEEWKERATALGHIGKGSKKNKGKFKAPKKPKQPDAMPKRPQSSYFLFSNERRVSIKSQYPDRKLTELSKLIAEEWKNISAEDKKGYEDRAAVCKAQYQTEIAEYKKTEEYQRYAERIEEWKAETKRFKSGKVDEESDEEIKVSLPRKPKDAKCPKRALTSYFLYAKEVREATKAEFPEKPITEIAKEISKKWKVLTADEKKPYEEESKRLKEQYKKDIAEYEGSEAQNEYRKQLEEWKVECDRRKQAAKAKLKRKKEAQRKSPKGKTRKTRKSPKKPPKKAQRMDYSSSDSDSDSGSSSSGSYSSTSSGSGSDSSSSSSDSD